MKRLERARPSAQASLQSVCDAAQSIADAQFGGRIWAMPLWYISAIRREARIRTAYAEVGLHVAQRPRMVLLAKVLGPFEDSSHIPWAVGKGFVGRLALGQEEFDILHHSRFWPTNLPDMTQAQWAKLDERQTEGRTLEDARTLKRMYGTAVGVRLADPDSMTRLGCLTLHTKHDEHLSDNRADLVASLLLLRAHQISRQIAQSAGIK